MAASKIGKNGNLIPNGDFSQGRIGAVPDGWTLSVKRPSLAPQIKLAMKDGRKVLFLGPGKDDDCCGRIEAPVTLKGGATYRMHVRFRHSADMNPQDTLLFCVQNATGAPGFNNGIFHYRRVKDGLAMGEGVFPVRPEGQVPSSVRIYYRMHDSAKAWVESISLEPCDPIAPREVKLAATMGNLTPVTRWAAVLDAAGKAGTDLILLPESINGGNFETFAGPSCKLMSAKARQYGMYVAGGMYYHDKKADRVYNTAVLFDRKGKRVFRYDKNHLYTPEILDMGVTSGDGAEVYRTDFGTIGIITCYDSWFSDVSKLLALRGAEVILFPNAGYYRSLMPARAADDCVRFVTSPLGGDCGIWDTSGADIEKPDLDPSCCPCHPPTYKQVRRRKIGKVTLLTATMDLSKSPSPHNWGGPCMSAPGGRRNRAELKRSLYPAIQAEIERWWDND